MADVRLKWLVAAAAVFNFLSFLPMRVIEIAGGYLYEDSYLVLLVGVFFGQIGAAAHLLVWGEGPFLHRLIVHWTIGYGMVVSLLIGYIVIGFGENDRVVSEASIAALVIACVLPSLSLGAQLPLWPLRIYLRWRVELHMDRNPVADQPLSIQDMLAGTAVAAVTLGLARAILLADPIGIRGDGLTILNAASFGMALCIGIPAIICVLTPVRLTAGILVLSSYLLLGVSLLVGIPTAIYRMVAPVEMLVVLLIGALALTATLAAPLLVLRSCGYRLARPSDRRGRAAVNEPG